MKLQSDPQIPCIMSVLHRLGSCAEVAEKSVVLNGGFIFFFLFGLGQDLKSYLQHFIPFGPLHSDSMILIAV